MVTFTGVTENAEPEQTFAVIAVMAGTGVMLTCTLNGEPVHVLATGVTVYVAVTLALVVLVKVCDTAL